MSITDHIINKDVATDEAINKLFRRVYRNYTNIDSADPKPPWAEELFEIVDNYHKRSKWVILEPPEPALSEQQYDEIVNLKNQLDSADHRLEELEATYRTTLLRTEELLAERVTREIRIEELVVDLSGRNRLIDEYEKALKRLREQLEQKSKMLTDYARQINELRHHEMNSLRVKTLERENHDLREQILMLHEQASARPTPTTATSGLADLRAESMGMTNIRPDEPTLVDEQEPKYVKDEPIDPDSPLGKILRQHDTKLRNLFERYEEIRNTLTELRVLEPDSGPSLDHELRLRD